MACNGRLRRLEAQTRLKKLLKTNNFTSLSEAEKVLGINKGLLSLTLSAARDPGPTICELLGMPTYSDIVVGLPDTLDFDVDALTDISINLQLIDCIEPYCVQKYYKRYWQEKRCYPCRRGTRAALKYAANHRIAISDIYGERVTLRDVKEYLQDTLQS